MPKCKICTSEVLPLTPFGLCTPCERMADRIPIDRILESAQNATFSSVSDIKWPDTGEKDKPEFSEWRIVRDLWNRIPSGASTWADAFYTLLQRARHIKEN